MEFPLNTDESPENLLKNNQDELLNMNEVRVDEFEDNSPLYNAQ